MNTAHSCLVEARQSPWDSGEDLIMAEEGRRGIESEQAKKRRRQPNSQPVGGRNGEHPADKGEEERRTIAWHSTYILRGLVLSPAISSTSAVVDGAALATQKVAMGFGSGLNWTPK